MHSREKKKIRGGLSIKYHKTINRENTAWDFICIDEMERKGH